ncbi:MAG TPA: DUF167 domain-containing protein [Amycolatopsis sp.]|nr:DUF167 domain-containing protein [Amycolatopsis sp.]
MRFPVRVKPGAKRDAVGGDHAGALIVAVRAPALEGKANEAVRTLLAKALGVRGRDVLVVRGERGRDKLIEVDGAPSDALAVLGRLRAER